MKKLLIPTLWLLTIVAACFLTCIVKENAQAKAIGDAKLILEKGSFSDADMTILYAKHGKGDEQQMWFEGVRSTVELKKAKELIARQKRELDLAREQSLAIDNVRASYENSTQAHKNALDAANKLIEAYEAKDAAMAETVVEKPANYNSAVPRSAPSYLPAITKAKEPEQVAPNWQMPTRNQALAIVRKNAETEWPNNFSMMEYELNRQMEAYDKLTQYQKQNWKPLMKTIMNNAASKWPNNYNMMVYEIERQIDAKDRLESVR